MALNSFIKVFRRLSPPGCDLSRLRGPLIVALCGAAIYAASNYLLAFSLGADGSAVYPRQRPLGFRLYEYVWQRVSAVDRLYHNGQLPHDTRLGVYIGVSTTATGIQRKYLDARANTADRWIVLSGAGLSFENIESVMYPVFFCGLKPTTVVFGVHPPMLVGERYIEDEPLPKFQRVVGRSKRSIAARLESLPVFDWLGQHWAVRRRAIMGEFLRTQIYGVRLLTFYTAGVTAQYLASPAIEPWDDDPLWLWTMDDPEQEFAKNQQDFWARRGHFVASSYDPDGAQARSFVRMIRAFRKQGTKVYVVIMPLRSTVRQIIPSVAKPCLYEALNRAFPEAPPTVIDLQEAMPDDQFTDEAHLSKSGAEQLSKMVAERLREPEDGTPADQDAATGPGPR